MTLPNTIILLTLLLISQWTSLLFAQAGLSIGDISSTKNCYTALQSSKGSDGLIDKSHYVTFINALSNDAFTSFQPIDGNWGYYPVTDFNSFPRNIQDNFWSLACGGSGGALIVCNEAYLETSGSADGETPTDRQTDYLYRVCTDTENAIESSKPNSDAQATPPAVSTTTDATTIPQSYTGPLTIHLSYQIMLESGITSDLVQSDLALAAKTWMTEFLNSEYHGKSRSLRGSYKFDGQNENGHLGHLLRDKTRSLRGGNAVESGTRRPRSLLVTIANDPIITGAAEVGECIICHLYFILYYLIFSRNNLV